MEAGDKAVIATTKLLVATATRIGTRQRLMAARLGSAICQRIRKTSDWAKRGGHLQRQLGSLLQFRRYDDVREVAL